MLKCSNITKVIVDVILYIYIYIYIYKGLNSKHLEN
jgi:hypothetical protein